MKRSLCVIVTAALITGLLHLPCMAQEDKIRVKVEVVGDHNVDKEAKKYISKALGGINDVEDVEEDPQVYIHVIARRLVTNRGRRLGYVMGTASSEIVGLVTQGGQPLTFSDYNGLWVEMGPNLRDLCEQCVGAINGGVLQRMRNLKIRT